MFRKLILSIVAVFYLAATSGMVINVHYCMGKISSVTFNEEADHNEGACGKCGMAKTENHCCKDEISKGKMNDSHQTSSTEFESIHHVNPFPALMHGHTQKDVVWMNAYCW